MDDIILWPCGTWCFVAELGDFTYMSDDYERIREGTVRHALIIEEI